MKVPFRMIPLAMMCFWVPAVASQTLETPAHSDLEWLSEFFNDSEVVFSGHLEEIRAKHIDARKVIESGPNKGVYKAVTLVNEFVFSIDHSFKGAASMEMFSISQGGGFDGVYVNQSSNDFSISLGDRYLVFAKKLVGKWWEPRYVSTARRRSVFLIETNEEGTEILLPVHQDRYLNTSRDLFKEGIPLKDVISILSPGSEQ